MIHAVTAVFSTALTVLLMLGAIAVSAIVLFGTFALAGPVLALLVTGLGQGLWAGTRGAGRLPRLTARGCVHATQCLAVRLPAPRRCHRWVARHPRSAQGARMHLVRRRRVTPEVLAAVFLNESTVDKVRIAVVRRCEDFGGAARVMPTAVEPWGPLAYQWPLTYAEDAVLVQHALRRCLRSTDPERLRGGYARLARLAGPEVVWAMEHEHVGSLELMDPVVRRSMQPGDTDVLLEWLD